MKIPIPVNSEVTYHVYSVLYNYFLAKSDIYYLPVLAMLWFTLGGQCLISSFTAVFTSPWQLPHLLAAVVSPFFLQRCRLARSRSKGLAWTLNRYLYISSFICVCVCLLGPQFLGLQSLHEQFNDSPNMRDSYFVLIASLIGPARADVLTYSTSCLQQNINKSGNYWQLPQTTPLPRT